MNIIEELVLARKELGLSQVQLAEKVGIVQSHLSKIESGKVSPQLSTLIRLCNALNKTIVLHIKD